MHAARAPAAEESRRDPISGRPDELFGGALALWAARSEAPLQEVALHHIACERKGRAEVIASNAVVPAPKLKLAQRRGVERIAGKTIAVSNGVYLFEPTLRAWSESADAASSDASTAERIVA